jgi:hypothetical protein
MKRALRRLLPVLLAVALPAIAAAGKKADVKITNGSDWEIHHFYLSSTDDGRWGPDQLGDEVIGSGESFTLAEVPCGEYDVKLVDEEGDECVVGGVDICGKGEEWALTSKDLLECQAATKAASE